MHTVSATRPTERPNAPGYPDQVWSLDDLTARERAVFEQLVAHKTSKEVANSLGLAPDTVNKHIAAVRGKWLANDRNQAIRLFERLRLAEKADAVPPQNLAPQILPGDGSPATAPEAEPDLPGSGVFRLSDVLALDVGFPAAPQPKGLEALDERFGKAWRILAVPLLAVLFGLAAVCMLTIGKVLSEIL